MNSVLYIPDGMDLWRTLSRLGEYAEGNGWSVGAYSRDWADVIRLLGTGDYQIGIVPSVAQLDPGRLPRVVGVDELEAQAMPRPRQQWLSRT